MSTPASPAPPDSFDPDADQSFSEGESGMSPRSSENEQIQQQTSRPRPPSHSNTTNVSTASSVTYHTTNINIATGSDSMPMGSPNSAATQSLQALFASPTAAGSSLDSAPLLFSSNPLLSNFQSHAMSTVQNLAASFGQIATVLQKDQAHTAREEEATKKKLAMLQNSISGLSAQHKELAALLVRTGEKSTAQARELNERVNNLNNKLIVGLTAVGVNTPELKSQQQSRRGSMTDAAPSGNTREKVQYLSQETSMQLLLDRMTRLEADLASERRRNERLEAGLHSYFGKLQEQMKKGQQAVVNAIATTTDTTGDDTRFAITAALEVIEAPTFDIVSSEGSVGSGSSRVGFIPPSVVQLPESVTNLLQEVLAKSEDSLLRQQALMETVLPDKHENPQAAAQKQSAFERRLEELQKDMATRKEQTRIEIERMKATGVEMEKRKVQKEQQQQQQQQQEPNLSLSKDAGRATGGKPESSASQPPPASQTNVEQSRMETHSAVSGGAAGGGGGGIAAAGAPFSTSQPVVSIRPASQTDSASTGIPRVDHVFTPRSAMAAEQLRLEQQIELAAMNAVAQVEQARKKKQGDALLSAEVLAATAAAQSAQIAAKRAEEVLKSMEFMRENWQFTTTAASGNSSSNQSSTPATNVLHDLLFDDAPESSRTISGSLSYKKVSDRLSVLERQYTVLDSTVQSLGNQLQDLNRSSQAHKETSVAGMKTLGTDFSNILTQFQLLSRQFQAQHKILDGRITNYRDEFDLAMKHSIDALSLLERNLEKKADMKLVLDKVSRSEYLTQIKQLKKVDDEILNRSVNREEYRLQLNEIREVMSEDQRERISNITRIANELSKLVGDLEQKASRQELIDIANVLNSMPKVHEEVEHLKSYVNAEIQTRANEILDVTVDRKQLKRSMQRLLKSLQDEVTSATLPVNCDVCALRTGVHSGTNCLSCAQQMKLNARLGTYAGLTASNEDPPPFEVLASRGGGFMVTTASSPASSPPSTSHGKRPGSRAVTEWRAGSGSAIRPGTGSRSLSRTMVLPPAQGATTVDHFPLPTTTPATPATAAAGVGAVPSLAATPIAARSELGSDGKVYTARGSRTHRLVANTAKSRARAEEEGDPFQVQQEHKDATEIRGSQSARVRR